MNLQAKPFEPRYKKTYSICTTPLSKSDAKIFNELCSEWQNTPTLSLLLDDWKARNEKTLALLNTQHGFSLLLLNVSSLNAHLPDVINLVCSTEAPLVLLTGTHHDDQAVKVFASHMFNLNVFTSKGSNAFGGVLVGVHKSIRVSRVPQFADCVNCIVIEIETTDGKIQLATCYSPPGEPLPLDLFDRILQRNPATIFAGDLNAKHPAWSLSSTNHKGSCLHAWLATGRPSSSYVIVNKHVPTSTRSNATIDIIIAPSALASDAFSVLPPMGSDHLPVLWQPNSELQSHHVQFPIKRTRWRLLEIFLTFTASYWLNLSTTMPNTVEFFSLYERFLSLSAARLTFVSFQASFKPSLPNDLVSLIEEKRRVLKLFRTTRHPAFAVQLRDLGKLVRQALFHYKKDSWLRYCRTLNDCDVHAFWRKAKRHFNARAPPIDGFVVNKAPVSDPLEMCDLAGQFYSDQFAPHAIINSPIEVEAAAADRFIEEQLSRHSPRMIITYPQIIRSLATLKNKSSSGVDGVSNRILKLLPFAHLPILFACFNVFAMTHRTPPHWHVAKMILLSKSKSKTTPVDETRPISLLPSFSKLYEKCFLIHLRQWIADRGLLPDEQTGFRPGHNMSVRIAAMIDQIGQGLSKNTATAGLFVDFKSAFNQLWFQGLWLKLLHLDCPLNLVAWLRNYLLGRSALIEIKGTRSSYFPLRKGVPQGSCVGPVLFILYHYDMLDAFSPVHWKHLFADDLAIIIAPSSTLAPSIMMQTLVDHLLVVLRELLEYSVKWKQEINFNKTHWILFHRQVAPRAPTVSIDGRSISRVNTFKYLGTILDAKMSFSPHICYTQSKLKANLNVFKRIAACRMLSEATRSRLYHAFIRPHYLSLLNIFPILKPAKQAMLEAFNRQVFRVTHQWHDARNIEIEALPKYTSVSQLTDKHWQRLLKTILRTNPDVVADFLQHKLSIVFLHEYITNASLAKVRKSIFGKGRLRKQLLDHVSGNRLSLLDHILCFLPQSP